mmetsp:Transcript_45006/g.88324  ORF Transcript_45006/g.88324 Transcript_45006/m.88324 type:complete len:230 (+) Transcript_45006:1998-2687(+)
MASHSGSPLQQPGLRQRRGRRADRSTGSYTGTSVPGRSTARGLPARLAVRAWILLLNSSRFLVPIPRLVAGFLRLLQGLASSLGGQHLLHRRPQCAHMLRWVKSAFACQLDTDPRLVAGKHLVFQHSRGHSPGPCRWVWHGSYCAVGRRHRVEEEHIQRARAVGNSQVEHIPAESEAVRGSSRPGVGHRGPQHKGPVVHVQCQHTDFFCSAPSNCELANVELLVTLIEV